MSIAFSIYLETQAAVDNENQINGVHTSGCGLQQAQVGVQTSFTVDARIASNQNDDVKVVVTSKIDALGGPTTSHSLPRSPVEAHMPHASGEQSRWNVDD